MSLCVGVAILLASVPARGGLADQVGATFALLTPAFASAFPPVEGLVVGADGDLLYMDLSEGNAVFPGQEFTVFRRGEVFRHPITNQPLGRFEDRLGYAQVVRVFRQYSAARYIPLDGQPRPRPEDGVRITRGRIKTAVAPLLDLTQSGADFRRVPYLIAVALERTKRFEVKDPQAVATLFARDRVRVEAVLNDPGLAAGLGRGLEVSGWIVPVLLERGGVTYLDTTWISVVTGTALFSRREVLTRPAPAEEQRFPWEPLAE